MSNYEYLGKKEIFKRVKALGYEMPKISDFSYIKYDCIEWMESHELKITVQRGGEWLRVVEKRAHVHPVTLFCDYVAGKYITRQKNQACSRWSCRKLSGYASGHMYIDKLTKIFYDFMIYTFKAVYLTF